MISQEVIQELIEAGFLNINIPSVFGPRDRLHIHPSAVPVNTLFNLSSGHIYVGEGSFFGHNCMVLTGKHHQIDGHPVQDFMREGRDIHIGKRCWIASGAIILGNVKIGDDCTVAAGAIVTKDVPPGTTVKGVW